MDDHKRMVWKNGNEIWKGLGTKRSSIIRDKALRKEE